VQGKKPIAAQASPKAETPQGFALASSRAEPYQGQLALTLEFTQPIVGTQAFDTLIVVTGAKGETVEGSWALDEDAKTLPFAEAEPGATGLELLLGLALRWGQESGVGLMRALGVLTHEPARVLGGALGTLQASAGQLVEGGVADVCIFDSSAEWTVTPELLRSQGRHTPFAGHALPGVVRYTIVGGQVAFEHRGE
jgi:hypothetical protein